MGLGLRLGCSALHKAGRVDARRLARRQRHLLMGWDRVRARVVRARVCPRKRVGGQAPGSCGPTPGRATHAATTISLHEFTWSIICMTTP